jgi:hypothetical protein
MASRSPGIKNVSKQKPRSPIRNSTFCRATSVARWYIYFQTKNTDSGKLLKVLQWKMLVFFIYILSLLQQMVYFMAIRYICGHLVYNFPVLVCCTEKIRQPLRSTFQGSAKNVGADWAGRLLVG